MSAAPPGPVVGRFAPTPSGPLHAGSLVAALGSWLDARARGGRWLVRIEDLDAPRNVAGAAEAILGQLARCGLRPDEAPRFQSADTAPYRAALATLLASGRAYPCGCSRRDVAAAALAGGEGAEARQRPGEERVYPGTCRGGLAGKAARSIRLRTDAGPIEWHDRRLGPQTQDVAREVGDFVLERADGVCAYQLAVVVDDAAQAITDVVRGEDLADNTPRQIVLQRLLGVATPRYLHLPLVRGSDGEKLSKQTGAAPLSLATDADALAALAAAGRVLGLTVGGTTLADWLAAAVTAWPDTIAVVGPDDAPP